ncbi:MAG: tryptophan halogenase [Robiginitomaculum sp.]|nr:MAG: tryptophan halogenase [Robiginitomaculum sp.]
MSNNRIRKVVIVGGGSAGWMTAATLSKLLKDKFCDIELIESEQIGTIGVGEATIPLIGTFNRTLGIDETDFVKATKATFKLGIQFENWGRIGDKYFHPFGPYGLDMGGVSFHAFYQKRHPEHRHELLEQYSLQALAAKQNRFMRPVNAGNSPLSTIAYAFHFDAGLYAQFLRGHAEGRGVKRTEGKVVDVTQRDADGFIESVTLEDGQIITGDLFIDCSGFRGLLIEQALKTGYNDWGHWLPCDRAVTVASESLDVLRPYTRSMARDAGWQWQIPLQHRVGNGHVYSSKFMEDDVAQDVLMSTLESKPLADPHLIRFSTGHRKKFWNKNCVAIGLSAGFLEPLESTGLHVIQSGISSLLQMFPTREFNQIDIDRYNRITTFEFERIRDFIILHYHATQRDDTDFWNYTRTMSIPDYLVDKMAVFKSQGRIFRENEELFNDTSWFSVMMGQNFVPDQYDTVADVLSTEETTEKVDHIREVIATSVTHMPLHADYIAKNCTG